MNISELAARVADEGKLTGAEARRLIEATLKAIVDTAVEGGETSLPGFGKFKVASRAERQGKNPATGKAITIAASRRLTFSAAKPVRDALNP